MRRFFSFSFRFAGARAMSGPIIRSGPSPQFSQNWDGIFGGGKNAAKKPAKKPAAKAKAAAPKSVKKKAAKKSAKKK